MNRRATSSAAATRILVVEDEALLRMMIVDELRDAGYEVFEAGSGDEATDLLLHEEDIALVFTDVQMPGRTDGLALARNLQNDRPNIAVIITSGNYGPGDVAGLGPFVPKTYDVACVLKLVAQVLRR